MDMRESVKKFNLLESEAVTMIWLAVMSSTEWNKKEDLVLVSTLSTFQFHPLPKKNNGGKLSAA